MAFNIYVLRESHDGSDIRETPLDLYQPTRDDALALIQRMGHAFGPNAQYGQHQDANGHDVVRYTAKAATITLTARPID